MFLIPQNLDIIKIRSIDNKDFLSPQYYYQLQLPYYFAEICLYPSASFGLLLYDTETVCLENF